MSTSNKTFRYVLIPADNSRPIEEHTADSSGGLEKDALVESARAYFAKHASATPPNQLLSNATPQQKQALIAQVRQQQKESTSSLSDDQILSMVEAYAAQQHQPSCEIVALTVPTKGNRYHAVSMYTASDSTDGTSSATKNDRANALMEACGHGQKSQDAAVRGDVFVGRCVDNEAEEWRRIDFVPSDAAVDADWIRVAITKGGGGGSGSGGSAHSLSGVLQKMQQTQVSDNTSNNSAAANATIENKDKTFSWTQADDEVELRFAVASGTKAKYVKVQFGRDTLKVTLAGQILIQGKTGGKVLVDESTYTLQDEGKGRELCVVLAKANAGVIWPSPVA